MDNDDAVQTNADLPGAAAAVPGMRGEGGVPVLSGGDTEKGGASENSLIITLLRFRIGLAGVNENAFQAAGYTRG